MNVLYSGDSWLCTWQLRYCQPLRLEVCSSQETWWSALYLVWSCCVETLCSFLGIVQKYQLFIPWEQEFEVIFMMLCPVWKSFYYQKNDLIKEIWYIKGGCLLEIDPLRALIIWTNHEQIVVHATEFCDCINYNSIWYQFLDALSINVNY